MRRILILNEKEIFGTEEIAQRYGMYKAHGSILVIVGHILETTEHY